MGVGCDRGQLHAYCECRGWHLWEPAAQLKLEEVTPGRSALWGGQGRWSGGQLLLVTLIPISEDTAMRLTCHRVAAVSSPRPPGVPFQGSRFSLDVLSILHTVHSLFLTHRHILLPADQKECQERCRV